MKTVKFNIFKNEKNVHDLNSKFLISHTLNSSGKIEAVIVVNLLNMRPTASDFMVREGSKILKILTRETHVMTSGHNVDVVRSSVNAIM